MIPVTNRNNSSRHTDYQPSDYNQTNNHRNIDDNEILDYDSQLNSENLSDYEAGYIDGKNQEYINENIQHGRQISSAATGMVMGVIIASVVGLTIATLGLNQNRQPNALPAASPAQTTLPPTVNPAVTNPSVNSVAPTTVVQPSAVPQQTQIIVPAQPGATQLVQPNSVQPNAVQPGVIQPTITQPNAAQPTAFPSVYPSATGAPIPNAVPSNGVAGSTSGTGVAGQ
jgi:hypothetical protein